MDAKRNTNNRVSERASERPLAGAESEGMEQFARNDTKNNEKKKQNKTMRIVRNYKYIIIIIKRNP